MEEFIDFLITALLPTVLSWSIEGRQNVLRARRKQTTLILQLARSQLHQYTVLYLGNEFWIVCLSDFAGL